MYLSRLANPTYLGSFQNNRGENSSVLQVDSWSLFGARLFYAVRHFKLGPNLKCVLLASLVHILCCMYVLVLAIASIAIWAVNDLPELARILCGILNASSRLWLTYHLKGWNL